MPNRPNFTWLQERFSQEKEFELTASQYRDHTGMPLPKDISYTKTRSAIAKEAKKHGFELEIVEIVEKKILFKKRSMQQ